MRDIGRRIKYYIGKQASYKFLGSSKRSRDDPSGTAAVMLICSYFPTSMWKVKAQHLPMKAADGLHYVDTTSSPPALDDRQNGLATEERIERPPLLRSLLTRPVLQSSSTCTSQHRRVDTHAARLVDADRVRRARPRPGVYWFVYGCITAISPGLFALFPRIVAYLWPEARRRCRGSGDGFENTLARGAAATAVVWPLVVLQLLSLSVCDLQQSTRSGVRWDRHGITLCLHNVITYSIMDKGVDFVDCKLGLTLAGSFKGILVGLTQRQLAAADGSGKCSISFPLFSPLSYSRSSYASGLTEKVVTVTRLESLNIKSHPYLGLT
ncbi:hypothetical protein EDB89DRAFT_1914408 [Lactarius sanguifluus]|nr:hypothetical protein EDB89DRAFT_1914408 [Lactarius sanguifluus]